MFTGTHAEVGDGSGVVRGAFSYVDPSQQVRTVEYVADEQGMLKIEQFQIKAYKILLSGFHPQLSHPVTNTKAVQLATQRHLELYNKIAERNSNPDYALNAGLPKESPAVGM